MTEYLKLKDVAAALNISVKTLYIIRNTGAINFTKIGGATRISRTELERYLEDHQDNHSNSTAGGK